MPREKSNGAYTPLAANYFQDDAILEVGEHAELLYLRCLSFCAASRSDGYLTNNQIRIIAGSGLDNIDERIERLVMSGLLDDEDGGYLIVSWLKWNKSVDEMNQRRKSDRERKRGKSSQNDIPQGFQSDSGRNPDGVCTDSAHQYSAVQFSAGQFSAENILSDDESSDHGSLIADDWEPNQRHIDLANSLHLDIEREKFRFRTHAVQNQRRLKNWSAGFTNWLKNGAVYAQKRGGNAAPRQMTRTEANLAYVQQLEEQERAMSAYKEIAQ